MKRTIILALSGLMSLIATSKQLSPDQAIDRLVSDQSVGNTPLRIPLRTSEPLQLVYTATADEQNNAFYIFNRADKGFIISGADDKLPIVIGYADKGSFDSKNIPANVSWWLEEYRKEIEAFLSNSNQTVYNIITTKSTENKIAISPLITTAWNQDEPYWDLCPVDRTTQNRSYTGCTATAMAQVMNFHKYPEKGFGSYVYFTNKIDGTLSFDFENTQFDWKNMMNSKEQMITEDSRKAVATLMFACGVAINSGYSSTGTGAASVLIPWALHKYFGYDGNAHEEQRKQYSREAWENLVYSELAASRPMVYTGQGSGAHAFVCDGYDGNGKFHINWGWGGAYDGYFALSALNPAGQGIGGSSGGYNSEQTIIYGIQPQKDSNNIWVSCAGNGNISLIGTSNMKLENITFPYPERMIVSYGLEIIPYHDTEETNGAFYDCKKMENVSPMNVDNNSLPLISPTIPLPQNIESMPAGKYKVFPAVKINGNEWQRLRFPYVNKHFLLLDIDTQSFCVYEEATGIEWQLAAGCVAVKECRANDNRINVYGDILNNTTEDFNNNLFFELKNLTQGITYPQFSTHFNIPANSSSHFDLFLGIELAENNNYSLNLFDDKQRALLRNTANFTVLPVREPKSQYMVTLMGDCNFIRPNESVCYYPVMLGTSNPNDARVEFRFNYGSTTQVSTDFMRHGSGIITSSFIIYPQPITYAVKAYANDTLIAEYDVHPMSAELVDGFRYCIDKDNKAMLKWMDGMPTSEVLSVPATIIYQNTTYPAGRIGFAGLLDIRKPKHVIFTGEEMEFSNLGEAIGFTSPDVRFYIHPKTGEAALKAFDDEHLKVYHTISSLNITGKEVLFSDESKIAIKVNVGDELSSNIVPEFDIETPAGVEASDYEFNDGKYSFILTGKPDMFENIILKSAQPNAPNFTINMEMLMGASGLENIISDKVTETYYNLQGIKVHNLIKGHIYITSSGRKIKY